MAQSTSSMLLKEELSQRQKKNTAFSLRSFARYLNQSPSAISEIISGKRIPSEKLIHKLAKRLNWSDEVISEAIKNSLSQQVHKRQLDLLSSMNLSEKIKSLQSKNSALQVFVGNHWVNEVSEPAAVIYQYEVRKSQSLEDRCFGLFHQSGNQELQWTTYDQPKKINHQNSGYSFKMSFPGSKNARMEFLGSPGAWVSTQWNRVETERGLLVGSVFFCPKSGKMYRNKVHLSRDGKVLFHMNGVFEKVDLSAMQENL